jgi:hypothetical protein
MTCQSGVCLCPPGLTDCNGTCVNLLTDQNHCGPAPCGVHCTGGMTCQNGVCLCPPGLPDCNGTCVNLRENARHCGLDPVHTPCGTDCTAGGTTGKICSNGLCQCPSGTQECPPGGNGICVNTNTDGNHCGNCTTVCRGGMTCQSGVCACPPGQINCGGVCRACPGAACNTPGRCAPGGTDCARVDDYLVAYTKADGCADGVKVSHFSFNEALQCVKQTSAEAGPLNQIQHLPFQDFSRSGKCNEVDVPALSPASAQKCFTYYGNTGIPGKCIECFPNDNCYGTCVDTTHDWYNCGGCGNRCDPSHYCCNLAACQSSRSNC